MMNSEEMQAMEKRMDAWDRKLNAKFEYQAMSKYEPTLTSMQQIETAAIASRRAEARSRGKRKEASESDESSEDDDGESGEKYLVRQSYEALTNRVMKRFTLEHGMSPYQDIEGRPWRRRIDTAVKINDKEAFVNSSTMRDQIQLKKKRNKNSWLTRWTLQKKDWRIIFIVLEPGSSAGQFSQFALPLSDVAEVYTLCLPGRSYRGCEEFPHFDKYNKSTTNAITTIATEARTAIMDIFNDKYILFGHGGGALIAYEISRLQQQAKQQLPKQLFVSGCFAPRVFQYDESDKNNIDRYAPRADNGELLSKRDDVALLSYLERVHRGDMSLPGLNDKTNTTRRVSAFRFKEKAQAEEMKARRKRAELASLSPALRENIRLRTIVAETCRAEISLMERYYHVADWPLECPVTAVAGQRDVRLTEDDLYQWRDITENSFRSRLLPGTAAYFFQTDGRSALIQLLRDALSTSCPPTPDEENEQGDEDDDFVLSNEEKDTGPTRGVSRRHRHAERPPIPVPKMPIDHSPFI